MEVTHWMQQNPGVVIDVQSIDCDKQELERMFDLMSDDDRERLRLYADTLRKNQNDSWRS